MTKTQLFKILLLLMGTNAMSQNITMEGIILNTETNQPVEFVNIGIPEKNTGTISNLDGKFKLVVPATFSNESLVISHINYFPEEVPVANSKADTIFLRPKTNELTEVVLSNEKKKLRNRKVGIKNYNPLLWLGTTSEGNDIIENAQFIRIPNKTVRIKHVNLYLRNGFEKDSTHIRINFYSNKHNAPGEKIVFQNLVQKKQIEPGWLKIDLTQHHIYLEEDFFIGVEFIPDFQNKMEVYLGAKLTKGKGYSRSSSQGQWNKLDGASTINVEIEY